MTTRNVLSEGQATAEGSRQRAEELTKRAAAETDSKERENLLRQALDCEVQAWIQGSTIQWPGHSSLKAFDEAGTRGNPGAVPGQSSAIPSVQPEAGQENAADVEGANVDSPDEPAASPDSDEDDSITAHSIDDEEGFEIGSPGTGDLEVVDTVEVTFPSSGVVEGQKPKKKPRKLQIKAKKKPRKLEIRSEAKSP